MEMLPPAPVPPNVIVGATIEEAAAHAVNAAIRRAGLEGRRKTNPVVDGQLVPPKKYPASGHGRRHKRRRDEPATAPSPRARRR